MKIAVKDGHRQGKKANAYKYPLTFLKWWSSLILKTFTVPAETIPSPNLFHSSQTLLANLNFPTSNRYLFLNSLKLCPLLTPSPTTWKNLSGSKFSNPCSMRLKRGSWYCKVKIFYDDRYNIEYCPNTISADFWAEKPRETSDFLGQMFKLRFCKLFVSV